MKKLIFSMMLAIGALPLFAGTGVPGLYQKIYSGANVMTGDPADGGDIIAQGAGLLAVAPGNPSISYTDPNTSTTYVLDASKTVAYKGVMKLTAGTTYTFAKSFDDNGHVRIISPDGVTTNAILDSTSWSETKYGSFTPDTTAYYGLLLYFGNGAGGVGPAAAPFTSAPYAGLMWNDVGLTSCTAANKSQWHRLINNDDALGEYLYTDLPDPDFPDVSNITASVISDSSATISFLLTEGKGDLTVEATDSDSQVFSVSAGKAVSASAVVQSGTLTGLEPGRSYSVNVHVATALGSQFDFAGGAFYLGEVSVAAGVNADSATLTPGEFVITRPSDAESMRLPLEVRYTCSGATPGTHYSELSGSVVIPAGASSAKVMVWPLQYGAGDHELTLTLTPNCANLIGTAAATITITGSEMVRPIRFVSTAGSDANDGRSLAYAFRTLERALDQTATLEDVIVLVEPGVYTTTYKAAASTVKDTHYIITNGVTVLGMGAKPEATHFLGTGTDSANIRVFYLNHADAKIKNLLISGGRQSYGGSDILIHTNGGTVEDCVISNGVCNSWNSSGGGVDMWAGRVSRCVFTQNSGNYQNYGSIGAHLVQRGGYVENCLFTKVAQVSSYGSFALAQLSGSAVMSSCTIAGNHTKQNASVVLIGANCRVYNCAIFGNTVDSDSTGHASVYTLSSANINQFVNCAADRQLSTTCILSDTAGFADEAGGDYHLGLTSVCRDAGDETYYVAPQVTSATDLDGKLRLSGSKRGTALDIGCYEFDTSALSLDVLVDDPVMLMEYKDGLQPVTASFHAVKNGGSGTAVYSWDFNGDGTIDLVTSDTDVTHVYTEIGVYTVILQATDDSGSAKVKKTALFSAGPKTVYVDAASANPTAPYVTRATAARTVLAAHDAAYDGTLILVEPGVYPYSVQASRLDVSKAVTIRGEGESPRDTVFTNDMYTVATPGNASFFRMANENALLTQVMLVDGFDNSRQEGGGITINAGVVSNCVIRHCGGNNTIAGGAFLRGGLITHSIFEDCYITPATTRKFQGVCLNGYARLENCLFRDFHSESSIVCMDGSGTSMRNCTIVDSSVTHSSGNVIAESTRWRYDGAAIEMISTDYRWAQGCGKIYNTVVANVSRPEYETYSQGGSGGVVTNTMPATNCANWIITYVYYNVHFPDTIHVFNNCATEDPQPINDTCFTGTAQSFFRDYAAGDLRPSINGILYNRGKTSEGQTGITDLAGNPRVIGRTVDIGALEAPPRGIKMVLR